MLRPSLPLLPHVLSLSLSLFIYLFLGGRGGGGREEEEEEEKEEEEEEEEYLPSTGISKIVVDTDLFIHLKHFISSPLHQFLPLDINANYNGLLNILVDGVISMT